MNILIIGYGKMGHQIEEISTQRGHKIVDIIDIDDNFEKVDNKAIDVAIEFTEPNSAINNFMECFKRNIPLVSGTTGWYDNLPTIKEKVINEKQTFLYSSNFSIGVYLFRKLNIYLAKMMDKYPSYLPSVTEIHHIHKKDAPSGTAITIANDLLSNYHNISSWKQDIKGDEKIMPVNSIRKGEEFGTHIVSYDSLCDVIEIKHKALNRKGLASGAVMGAEFIKDKKGFFTMEDLMNSLDS